ncbi:MAG: HAMP domain-containing protein [Oscillospiraceae bacterium]|nr:HAMP domain-containing protein [Oscillospiraceae bacterium]
MWAIVLLFAVALSVSAYRAKATAPPVIEGLAAVSAAQGGTWVAIPQKDDIAVMLVDEKGVREKSFSTPLKSGGDIAQAVYMTADAEGSVYLLKHFTDAESGREVERQELVVYTPRLLPFGRVKTIRLGGRDDPGNEGAEGETEAVRYLHVQASTSVILTGISADGGLITRETYDIEDLRSGDATIKSRRDYHGNYSEKVYKAVPAGTDVAVLSMTGRLFRAAEDSPQPSPVYPSEEAERSSYISFLRESAPGQVIAGEQKTGNILRLSLSDGGYSFLLEGDQPLGTLPYLARDILDISFCPENEASWVAPVQNPSTGADELIVCSEGEYSLITRVGKGFAATFFGVIWQGILTFAALLAVAVLLLSLYRVVVGSRMLLVKLTAVSAPLLLLALTLFGTYSYFTYRSSLQGTYETKASDQGNLLRALFGSETFDSITAPGLYGSVEYEYLRAQMETRDVYTSSAYFVDGKLYTGVDGALPCLYPFGIRHSAGAWELYRAAALTGKQQTGVIADRLGERMVSITPVGSSSGNTVFLLETGIFFEEINRQTGGYLRSYLLISALCILSACALLLTSFFRILSPLRGIIEGLEQFARGNRTVRLGIESHTNDELADIARVFNKMARDIDTQIYNLKAMGETYYRFVPRQIFKLLNKDNLADVCLGNAVEGKYYVLVANLYPRQCYTDFESASERLNRFFAIVHQAAGENGATLLSDSAGLRDLRLICPDGDAATRAAMEAIARIDGYNAKSPLQQRLDVSFFLHYTQVGFGVCGDGERYVPAMISPGLDEMLEISDEFRRLSSRLIVTQNAYNTLDSGSYFHRFIGTVTADGETSTGLYDFYDSSSPGAIRTLNETLGAFNKAMELYRQNRFYDAKNMFAIVLRENQYDNVARHYIFRCEKKL